MSKRFLWNELKKLVAIDHEISETTKQLTALETQQGKAYAGIPLIESNLSTLRSEQHTCTKAADELELEIKIIRAEESRKKDQLEKSSNPKEYGPLEREIAVFEDSIEHLENDLTKQWEKHEALEAEITELEQKCAEVKTKYNNILASMSEEKAALSRKKTKLEESWQAQAPQVPADLLSTYTEIRQRVANPVVSVVSNSCSACFNALLRQDIEALGRQTIIRCRGCYRFIFAAEAEDLLDQQAEATPATQPESTQESA